jgi:outer membrane protein assembly factor BamD
MTPFGYLGRFVVVGMMLHLLIGGCSHLQEEKSPGELMNEGMKSFRKGRYEAAGEIFQKVKDRYPYSSFAIEAELKLADSLYKRKVYEETYDAYDEFERLHPKNENIPYVIYQKGMCHFQQLKTIDRDQSHTLKAREEFERLIKRFPKDDYANKARKNIRKCLVYLSEYELYVGHFYFKMKKYKAALGRYTYLINNYPDMGQYHEALEYIRKCKEELSKDTGK